MSDGSAEEKDNGKRGLLGRLFRRRPKGEPGPAPEGEGPGAEPPAGEATPDGDHEEPGSEPGRGTFQQDEPAAGIDQTGPETEPAPPGGGGLLARLRRGLSRTRRGFVQKVDRVLFGKREIDAETLDELEEALVTADLGVHTATQLVDDIRERVSRKELASPEALRAHLKRAILEILDLPVPEAEPLPSPWVLMVVGVNGVGKTTTIGKLAAQYRRAGRRVILAAGDTFRAAAIEQLEIWGERVGAQVVRHQPGSDPAAVAYDAVEAAKARGADVVIVDTAGRLHTKHNLMEELKKVRRVIGKALPGAPHQVLLVLDATTGQNAVSQARLFHQAVGVDAIALTKLDGTARGGVIVAICNELRIPVRYIGIGEAVDDLRPFDPAEFVDALF